MSVVIYISADHSDKKAREIGTQFVEEGIVASNAPIIIVKEEGVDISKVRVKEFFESEGTEPLVDETSYTLRRE